MREKRKIVDFEEGDFGGEVDNGKKKLKTNEALKERIHSDLEQLDNLKETCTVIDFIKKLFRSGTFDDFPPIVYQHQIYSAISNKTKVDRDIETLRIENKIILFKSDSMKNELQDDVAIVSLDEFKEYVENILILNNPNLPSDSNEKAYFVNTIRKFLNETLKEVKELSVSESELKLKFQFKEKDLTTLIQCGLLTIKDKSNWWFAIPGIGKFRRALIDARKSLIGLVKRKRYNELNVDEIHARNIKAINKMGVVYLISDLIGKEVIRKVDSPLSIFVIKLCTS